jgi:hypothetical protein
MTKFWISAAFVLAACGVSEDDGAPVVNGVDGGGGGGGGEICEFCDARPVEVCSKMDILFIIDDSGSMGEEQGNLAQNFPQFIEVLDNYMAANGSGLDYRVAVTTTGRDLDYVIAPEPIPGFPITIPPIPMSESGDNGVMRQECGMTKRWIDSSDSNVASTFSCVAEVGTGGPSLEMPLYATQLALGDRISDGTNAGFLREDSLLGVIILTDEDDCSRTDNDFTLANDQCGQNNADYLPPSDTVAFLDQLTGSRARWATAVIAGATSCSSSFGDALKATNLQEFVSLTGDNAVFSSICDGDLATPLQEAIATFDSACQGFEPID